MDRFRWWFADLRDAVDGSSDVKFLGALALVALLAGGGYLAAVKVSQAGAGTAQGESTHLVRLVRTVRQPVKVRIHGHTVVRWRVRRKVVEARAQTVMQRETVRTPGGTKVITRPVVHYRVTYRKKIVKVNGKADARTVTDSQTNTVSRTETDVRTVTQPVTVVQTRTAVTTVTLPGTTVTLPGTTVTVTLPVTTG